MVEFLIRRKTSFVLYVSTILLVGCATDRTPRSDSRLQSGESLVLIKDQPGQLAFPPVRKPIELRSTYRPNLTNTIRYQEGRDFIVDYVSGQIRRTVNSRIPDFGTNMLHGVEDFDHSKFPGFGNTQFFVFADYKSKRKIDWPRQSSQVVFLPKTQSRLRLGEKLKIIAYGDSITAGGDATQPELIFWRRWADYLQQKYPGAGVEIVNGATGGDSTRNGLDRLQEKVLSQKPDLVMVGFGMNDHNIGGYGVPLDNFSKNLGTIIDRIREQTGAEIVVYSTFPPNPKWHFGSHNMPAYAEATAKVAREKHCAFADIYGNWTVLNKKPEDLLGNNINHPNDFGHGIYFEVLRRIGL